jgi:DNA-binding helix-hairpin-helix protein with protein kinase domain/Tfp pilus assembly protein PilF
MPARLYNEDGNPVDLGRELNRSGGEGVIYELQNREDLVAKVYREPPSSEKAAKVSIMPRLCTERLLNLCAWPTKTLHDRGGGRLNGFVMPKIVDHEPIHLLYGVKDRLVKYPDANWPFLLQTAANVARAFQVVHDHGHVIGDINHGGVLVSKKATVKLVDCDSFQITWEGHTYLCGVGQVTHTPPEFQGQNLGGVVRSQSHDAFGLAIIIFQLLFMGRHPFSGRFLDRGDMLPDRAIKEYRFAYGPGAAGRRMLPPPGALNLEAVTQPVAQLFERAFGRGTKRPSAAEWVKPLSDLSASLRQCTQNSGHYFLKTLSSCPWCQIEIGSGVAIFNPAIIVGTWTERGGFTIAAVWARINQIEAPGPLPQIIARSLITVTPSTKAKQLKRNRIFKTILAGSVLVAISSVLSVAPVGAAPAAWVIVLLGVVATVLVMKGGREARGVFENSKRQAESTWNAADRRWHGQGGDEAFRNKLRELEKDKAEYEKLPNLRLQRLRQLEQNVRQRQKQKFLDRYRIDSADIRGLGHARKIALRSYGIETADDVTRQAVLAVPGFGPVYTSYLLTWRNMIEQKFVFNPNQGVDPADRAAVEREITVAKSRLEEQLQKGPRQLLLLSSQVKAARNTMQPAVEQNLRALVQAETDLKTVAAVTTALVPLAVITFGAVLVLTSVKQSRSTTAVDPSSGTLHGQTNQPYNANSPELKNGNPGPSLEEQAQARYLAGIELTKARKYQDAIAEYQQALVFAPKLAAAHHEIGFAYLKLGKYKESIEALKQAAALKPDNADTHLQLALAYKAMARWEEAAGAFERSIELKPENAAVHYQLGQVYEKLNDNDAALNTYREAIRLKADYSLAHYALGLLHLQLGDADAAMSEYEILAGLNKKLADQLYERINE